MLRDKRTVIAGLFERKPSPRTLQTPDTNGNARRFRTFLYGALTVAHANQHTKDSESILPLINRMFYACAKGEEA